MTEKRRIRPEDGVIVYLISFLLMQLMSLALSGTEGDLKTYLSYLIPQVCYIGVSAVYLIATRTEFRFLPRRENLKAWHYGLAVTAALGIFFFALLPNYGLQILFEKIGKTATVTVPALDEAKDYVLCLITLCILPSIGEELVFRKIFCDGFSAYGGRIAVAMSGVLFGLSHLNLAQTVHQVFLGCLLAYLYMKTSNITLTVLIHFINNFLALFFTLFGGNLRLFPANFTHKVDFIFLAHHKACDVLMMKRENKRHYAPYKHQNRHKMHDIPHRKKRG